MALTRSEQMSRIRSKHTSPERELRQLLWRADLRYRIHAKTPVGRPDIVFIKAKVAVFVDGCFWHGCPDHYVRPRSSEYFWAKKLADNVRRDARQTRALEELGWRVCRIWEHEIFASPDRVVTRIESAVMKPRWRLSSSWRVLRVQAIDDGGNRERRFMRDLRDGGKRRQVTGRRITAKWRVKKVDSVK